MIQFLRSAVPIALIWCAITGRVTLDSLLLGYILALVTLISLHLLGIRFGKLRSWDQPVAVVVYIAGILVTAFQSSLKVAKLVLSPQIKLKTGVIALDTGDLSESQLLTALSAHGINTTPGEIVIDIIDGGVLYIHCLDLEASRAAIDNEQKQRLRLLRRILGERDHE